jgi:hypothetical protein
MAYSYSSIIDKLKTRRDAIIDELNSMTSASAGGKPNSSLTGVDHVGYKRSLYEELAMLQKQLAGYADPFEIVIEGDT